MKIIGQIAESSIATSEKLSQPDTVLGGGTRLLSCTDTKAFAKSQFGKYVESDTCFTLRANGGDSGGERNVIDYEKKKTMTYQKTTGSLMANSHPGSYSGQDAYSDLLITENRGGTTHGRLATVRCIRSIYRRKSEH